MKTTLTLRDALFSSSPVRTKIIKCIDHTLGALSAFLLKPQKTPKTFPSSLSNILIIRPGGIGDAVLLLPVLSAVRKANPGLTIDILCERRNAEVFCTQQGLVDHVHLYDSLTGLWTVLHSRYSVVIDTEQWHYASALVSYFSGTSFSTGFNTRPLRAKLFHNTVDYPLDKNETAAFLSLFKELLPPDMEKRQLASSFHVPEEKRAWAKRTLSPQSIAIFTGASVPERRLHNEQILELIRKLLSRGYAPVLLGGKDVQRLTAGLTKKIADPRILDLSGKTTLIETAALIEQCLAYIGPDSGPSHLAYALGVRTVTLFGPSNVEKWAPHGPLHKIIHQKIPCSPCTLFGYGLPTCHSTFACLRTISADRILEEALV